MIEEAVNKDLLIEELRTKLSAKNLEIKELLDLTKQVNRNTSAEDLFKIYFFMLRALYQVNSIAIVYKKKHWKVRFSENIDKNDLKKLEVDQSWVQFQNITEINHNEFDVPKQLKWIIPVKHKDNFVAFVFLDDFKEGYETDESCQNFVLTITNFIITAIENKRLFKQQLSQSKIEAELKTASEIQKMLVPTSFPQTSKLDIAAYYKPYESVGGDYYDIFPISENEYMICIADVSGKNVSAALLMANFQAMLHANKVMRLNLPELTKYLNNELLSRGNGERFITTVLAIYRQELSYLQYVSAGHEPIYYVHLGTVKELNEGCSILGIKEDLKTVQQGEFEFKSGSYVIMYTDGLTDTENEKGEKFNPIPYLEMASLDRPTAQDFLDGLILEINLFLGESSVSDDLTILVLKVP